MPNDPFVEAAAIPNLGPVRYMDVRDKAAFDAAHAPGAVLVPVDAWDKAAKSAGSGFESSPFWQQAIGPLGLDPSVTAVVYDAGAMTNAARVWFILQYFGLKAVIVNGGWPAMTSLSLPDASPARTGFSVRPGAGSVGLIHRETLRDDLSGTSVFDSRTRAEYTGEDMRKNPRGGHLPGARQLSHAELMQAGHVHPAATLREMLQKTGFQAGDHIVTHCEGGGRAALAAAAAARAGYENVKVYYLSFADWAKDESCPVVRD